MRSYTQAQSPVMGPIAWCNCSLSHSKWVKLTQAELLNYVKPALRSVVNVQHIYNIKQKEYCWPTGAAGCHTQEQNKTKVNIT